MLHLLAATFLLHAGSVASPGADQPKARIRVHDATSGCFHSRTEDYEWTAEEGGFRRKGAFLTQGEVDALRKQILATRGEPKDLLAQVGFTPATLLAHREDVLAVAWPEAHRSKAKPTAELPVAVERCLRYEALAPLVLAELKCENWSSTTSYSLVVELPGDPTVTIQSDGLVPWKLPWTIADGERTWTSCDLALSRALVRLVDPEGPNAHLLDGTRYWTEEFWEDETFWGRFVGRELDAALSEEQYCRLAGYVEAMDRFRVEKAQTGRINLQPESLFLQIRTRYPSTLDGAWWWSPLVDGEPSATWKDFIAVHDAARLRVEGQTWLKDWKQAGPERTLEVHAVGHQGFAETMRDKFVVPPWKDAGFHGEPEFELALRRGGKWCGTVWLSSQEEGALIETAHAGPGEHWFDRLEIAFHPTKPTYGRVDAAGRFEVRTIAR